VNNSDAFQAHLETVAPVQAKRNALRNAGTSREQLAPQAKRNPLGEDWMVILLIVVAGAGFYAWKHHGRGKIV
jgi:hypothetical protein